MFSQIESLNANYLFSAKLWIISRGRGYTQLERNNFENIPHPNDFGKNIPPFLRLKEEYII